MNSIVSYPDRGAGGKSSYRGNCSPRLIEDLIHQFHLTSLSDFMVGGGTTRDVCQRLGLSGTYCDLNMGFDMMTMDIPERPENIFWHPPYGDMIVYSGQQYSDQEVMQRYGFDPKMNDLSRCKDWDEFVEKMNYCCLKQYSALEKGGRMFVLMGDMKRKGKLYSMLCDIAKPGTLEQIVIKAQHNCVSDSRIYTGSFIKIVHEYLMILRKDGGVFCYVSLPAKRPFDIRDSKNATWRDVVAAVMDDLGGTAPLEEIYKAMEGHKKVQGYPTWKEKIRQTLQRGACFSSKERGVWSYQKAAA